MQSDEAQEPKDGELATRRLQQWRLGVSTNWMVEYDNGNDDSGNDDNSTYCSRSCRLLCAARAAASKGHGVERKRWGEPAEDEGPAA